MHLEVFRSQRMLSSANFRAGDAARFAWDEFFRAEIRNPHTRKAYAQAVRQFLEWPDARGTALHGIAPAMVGDYLDQLDIGPTTKKQHLTGHSDPRTTRLYDRRQRRITRNIVERITI